MKLYTYLIISFLFCNIAKSQIQTNYFVDDVNTVDCAFFEFCVNDNAKITEVNLIENMSTYKNKETLQQLKDYLLSLEFHPDTKLKNACHNITFTFINSKYEHMQVASNANTPETQLLKGAFRYKNPYYQKTVIKRTKRIQKEKSKDDNQIYDIEWISNRQYNLIYKRMPSERLKKYIGESIKVDILEVFNDGSYVFRATNEHNDDITFGVIIKVK
ncbi:hypothetical protein [Neptunitalea lumnitzerae]|nr:hypothetical protein [Neptunitalea sp. Y10]